MSNHNINIKIANPEIPQELKALDIAKPVTIASNNAIDDYLSFVQSFFPIANDMLNNSAYSNVATLTLISAVEFFVRQISSDCIEVCPLTRKHCGSASIKLGSLAYYENRLGRAIDEDESLAGHQNIKDYLGRVLNIKIEKGSASAAALSEFNKLCQVRHAAVHSRGHLTYSNAEKIGIENPVAEHVIILDHISYQKIYVICNNVVRALNRRIFEVVLSRWIDNSILIGSWAEDKEKWNFLMKTFYSLNDNPENGRNWYHLYLRISKIASTVYAAKMARANAQGV